METGEISKKNSLAVPIWVYPQPMRAHTCGVKVKGYVQEKVYGSTISSGHGGEIAKQLVSPLLSIGIDLDCTEHAIFEMSRKPRHVEGIDFDCTEHAIYEMSRKPRHIST